MKYDELDDAAKNRARQWMFDCESNEFDETCLADAMDIAALLGFNIHHADTNWGVHDGVAFAGAWHADRLALDKLQEHAPQDSVLAAIGATLMVSMLALPASVVHMEPAVGKLCTYADYMRVTYATDGNSEDDENEWDAPPPYATAVLMQAKLLAQWMHKEINDDWAYRTTDDYLEECITSNDYYFDETGSVV